MARKQVEKNTRSASIAKTWKNKSVAQARATHNHVMVGKTEYRSVKAAFEALGLPLGQHIRFRQELKANGKATFGRREFKLVK